MNRVKIAALLAAPLFAFAVVTTANAQSSASSEAGALAKDGLLNRLVEQTGVYHRSKTGKTPDFVADPAWPQPLPHNWLLGQIGGLYVDQPRPHLGL